MDEHMSWFSRFTRAPEPERVEPQVKSFLIGQGGFNSAFTATDKSAFELLMGRDGAVNYDQCPPLAIGINRIIRALSGLDLHYYSGSDIVASRADVLIKDYQNHRDLSELIRSIQCAGKGYCVLIGNADFMPSKIATIRPADVSEFTDQYDNTFRLLITGGRWSGTYEQVEYGGDVYRTADKLRTIIIIHNQVSHAPLSPISAAMKTIIEGYNQNYRTIKNGGRLNSVWAFKDTLDEPETAARRLQANARVQQGGVTVTSGGDLDIKEYGLSAKDMDWANQLHRCDVEVYNLLGVPLPLVSNESATFNNYATASATFYEHTVLPLADYVFGIIGAYLAKPAKIQGAYMLADRENIDALQTKRLEQLELRKKVGVETANELRSSIYGREDIDGGDVLLVDARLVPIDSVTGLGI
jgi:phage portal protein BeeE